jgi:exodeoxyribonuclease-3
LTKIATWNVNSVRARQEHLTRWLGELRPDIALLQELKCVEDQFPREAIEDAGYNIAVVCQKSYNGVAVLSKSPIDVELTALPGDEEDSHARYLEVFTGGLRVASIYLPNGNPADSDKYPYKLKFMERLYARAKELLKSEDAFVLAGDYNVIPENRDVYNPAEWVNDALFKPETRAAFRKILYLGLTDAFRALHPNESHAYSFWDYQKGRYDKDEGIRIDHMLLSPQAADRLISSGIDKTPRGWDKPSDHTPVWCDISDTIPPS